MATNFHRIKKTLRSAVLSNDEAEWQECLHKLEAEPARSVISPLLACLPLEGKARQRAARALGYFSSKLVEEDGIEAGRNLLRRLMWQMSEESGNIGWGVPEAFAEILVNQHQLADEFAKILLSYVNNTGHEDNFCDYALLRRSCFQAVGRLAQVRPDLVIQAKDSLLAGLADEDVLCRVYAAEVLQIFDTTKANNE